MYRFRIKVITRDIIECTYMPQMFKDESWINMVTQPVKTEREARNLIDVYKLKEKRTSISYIYVE